MSGKYRPLLPQGVEPESARAGSSSTEDTSPRSRLQNRNVRTACLECRRRKIRCDGQRPICRNCEHNRSACEYDRDSDATPITMLRRTNEDLENQVRQLRELYSILRNQDEMDQREILRRMRTIEDPLEMLQFIKDGYGILSNERAKRMRPPHQIRGSQSSSGSPEWQPRPSNVGKVPRQPWTRIAGDELVTDLISNFFAAEHPYPLAFIDKDCFLSDMRSRNSKDAKYCSQLLVNAICALCCFTSDAVKRYDLANDTNMRELFYKEARRLLHLPAHDGSASLPTVQAFYLMSLYECTLGVDRASLIHRFSQFGSVHRYALEQSYVPGRTGHEVARKRRAIATVIWGSFFVASVKTLTSATVPPSRIPSFPRQFKDNEGLFQLDTDAQSRDHWRLIDALCDISETIHRELYESQWEPAEVTGCPVDMDTRIRLYRSLIEVQHRFSPELNWDLRPTAQTLYLRNFFDHAAIALLRPLPWTDEIVLPQGVSTVRDLVLHHCEANIRGMEDFINRFSARAAPLRIYYAPYQPLTVATTLVSHLDDPATHDIFTRGCKIAKRDSENLPVVASACRSLIREIQKQGVTMPKEVVPVFQSIGEPINPDVEDPLLPTNVDLVTSFSEDTHLTGLEIGHQMGELIESWDRLSLNRTNS